LRRQHQFSARAKTGPERLNEKKKKLLNERLAKQTVAEWSVMRREQRCGNRQQKSVWEASKREKKTEIIARRWEQTELEGSVRLEKPHNVLLV
jgi:hypothetical protein